MIVCRSEEVMDNMIREYAKNNSDTFTQCINVDEERTVYQFDQVGLNRFVNQVIQRTSELSGKIVYS
jgi:aspartyl/asparaginyl beta-hydroxylase (cupin superfamily)